MMMTMTINLNIYCIVIVVVNAEWNWEKCRSFLEKKSKIDLLSSGSQLQLDPEGESQPVISLGCIATKERPPGKKVGCWGVVKRETPPLPRVLERGIVSWTEQEVKNKFKTMYARRRRKIKGARSRSCGDGKPRKKSKDHARTALLFTKLSIGLYYCYFLFLPFLRFLTRCLRGGLRFCSARGFHLLPRAVILYFTSIFMRIFIIFM